MNQANHVMLIGHIDEKIVYINTQKEAGLKLQEICKPFNIYHKRMSKEISAGGYVCSKKLDRYVKIEKKEELEQQLLKNTSLNNTQNSTVSKKKDLNALDELKVVIEELTKRLEQLELHTSLQTLESKNISTETSNNFRITRIDEEPILRNFKLYPSILNQLDELKNKYPQYKKQDIINTLLLEALSKYTDIQANERL